MKIFSADPLRKAAAFISYVGRLNFKLYPGFGNAFGHVQSKNIDAKSAVNSFFKKQKSAFSFSDAVQRHWHRKG